MVTAKEINAVCEMDDPVSRNRRISEIYHSLAVALYERNKNLSWCAFATWASASVGRIIAQKEVPRTFRRLLESSTSYRRARSGLVRDLDHAVILRAAELALERVSASMAAGNLMVFGDIAPTFLALAERAPAPAGAPGPMRAIYDRYLRAFEEPDPVAAANGVLGANVAAACFEQERVQPFLAEAANIGLRRALRESPENRFLRVEEDVFDDVLKSAEVEWDCALTRHVMSLPTPEMTFDMGVDVPLLPDGRVGPAALKTLMDPDPRTLVATFDRTDGTLVGSRAHDWVRYDDRMNYMVNLFRSRQQEAELLRPLAALQPPG